jgi:hypothetical protein
LEELIDYTFVEMENSRNKSAKTYLNDIEDEINEKYVQLSN